MDHLADTSQEALTFACENCGADLKFAPGTRSLTCDYCQTTNEIPDLDEPVEELDFHDYLAKSAQEQPQITLKTVKCEGCGATSSLEPHIQSSACPYCNTPLIISNAHEDHLIKPSLLLPFKLEKEMARKAFRSWLGKLWFAPSNLKKTALNTEGFKGVYLPHWTYDTATATAYWGQRGVYYYTTETHWVTRNGKRVAQTRQVRRTRWYTVRGKVDHQFDDVLVNASNALPEKYIDQLKPWDLANLTPFDPQFLSGFITEKYQVDLGQGFDKAKKIMDKTIRKLIRRDIGGDTQRILKANTHYDNLTFKHILLPVYISAYRYKDKIYRFIVNARTGEVKGERPWSILKILGAALLVAIIVAVVYFLTAEGG